MAALLAGAGWNSYAGMAVTVSQACIILTASVAIRRDIDNRVLNPLQNHPQAAAQVPACRKTEEEPAQVSLP